MSPPPFIVVDRVVSVLCVPAIIPTGLIGKHVLLQGGNVFWVVFFYLYIFFFTRIKHFYLLSTFQQCLERGDVIIPGGNTPSVSSVPETSIIGMDIYIYIYIRYFHNEWTSSFCEQHIDSQLSALCFNTSTRRQIDAKHHQGIKQGPYSIFLFLSLFSWMAGKISDCSAIISGWFSRACYEPDWQAAHAVAILFSSSD